MNPAALVDSAANAIVGASIDGTVTTWNRAAAVLFGMSSADALGRHVEVVLPESRRVELRAMLARVASGSVQRLRTVHDRGHATLTFSPVRDGEGTIIGLSAIAHDITELTRSNEELEQFAYVASHDLQEPLRMISSYTELLAERYGDQLDEKAGRFIEHARDGAKRMSGLIDDLLEYSRIRTRGRELVPTSADEALDRALSNLGAAIRESDAIIDRDLAGARVYADETQLGQVFQNLVANAIKFRRDRPNVIIRVERKDPQLVFSVCDDGIGIAAEHHARVFQMFERLHTRSEYPGTGIGLALCKRILDRHGGRIWLESDGSTGSTFFFTLDAVES